MIALLTSPLVGPSTWAPAAREIADRGGTVAVVDLRSVVTPDGPDLDAVVRLVRDAVADDEHVVLVPHSGAGSLTPFLLAAIPGAIGAVFVDAGVPPAGVSQVPLAPPAFLEHLRSLAGGTGMLPPWGSWWGEAAMAEVIPDAGLRERLLPEMMPLPLGYFTSSAPVPPGWPALPGAYLAFGDQAYADDIARARGFGWPVRVLPDAQHLHAAVAPGIVADAILALVGTFGRREPF